MQEGLGLTVIQSLLSYIKKEQIRACICKQTDTVLVLQFNRDDYSGYIKTYNFIQTYDVIFQEVQDKSICRINLFVGDERICTITMDDEGIQAYVIDETTGLMIRPDHYGAIEPPKLVLPSAEFLSTYREASFEYYKIGIQGITPNPADDLLWKSKLLRLLDDQRLSETNKQFTYWLVHDDAYIGSIRIRERLTKELWEDNRGNFHFEVRPSRWKRGYGKLLVMLSMEKAVQNGIDLLVAELSEEDANHSSANKIMEKVGGFIIRKGKTHLTWLLPASSLAGNEIDYSRFM